MTTPSLPVKVALHEVGPVRRQGGETRVLLTPARVGATAGFSGTLALEPGERVTEHYHPYSDEFVYLVRGSVRVYVDGASVDLAADESLMVRRGARHRIECTGDGPAFAVFHIAPLAPSPELGHVDTEPVAAPDAAPPRVGGSPAKHT